MVTADSPLIGKPSGSIYDAIAWAGRENEEYIRELWRLGLMTGLDPAIAIAQWAHETADGTSPRWVTNRNPAGLGIEADSDAAPATLTQPEAAQLHIWCMVFTVTKPLSAAFNLPQSTRAFTTRWMRKIEERNYPHPVETVADLQKRYVDSAGEPQAVWAWDDQYAAKLVAKHRAIFGTDTAPTERNEGVNAQMITAEPCPIETYVAWSGPNRPGLAMPSFSKIVTHEVGNQAPTADEDMHRRFVLNGGGKNEVSFHFVVGPSKIVQLLYLDENAWHASDGYFGDGNRDAIGIEHIQIGDFNKTLAHGAWLQSELARNPRRFAIKNPATFVQDVNPENVDERMVQHNWESPDGKNCPEFIRNRGLWPSYVEAVRVAVRKPSPSTNPQPSPIWWTPGGDWGPQTRTHDGAIAWAFMGEVRAKRDVPLRRDAHAKAEVVHRLKAGDAVRIVGTWTSQNKRGGKGPVWAFLEYAPGKVGRAVLSAFTPYRWPTV